MLQTLHKSEGGGPWPRLCLKYAIDLVSKGHTIFEDEDLVSPKDLMFMDYYLTV